MINKINTLRTVANNLASHIFMEGKTIIKKPEAIIPGAIAAAGTVITLETKDNNANLVVEKDNKELQRATFNYRETPNGYEFVSAMSSYFYDDKDSKEIHQNHYLVEPELEKICEYSINYANAPIKKTTRTYIDKINSSIAEISGYKSYKTDYDKEETHTYGKKSLKRDIPALLKILEIIAPNSEFTLKMKDKLKKDNKTSLVAFEANDTENGNKIVRGFVSTNGDSVSYRINTGYMSLIGEQGTNKELLRAYLTPEKKVAVQKEEKTESASEIKQTEQTGTITPAQTNDKEKERKSEHSAKNKSFAKIIKTRTKKEVKKSEKKKTSNIVSKTEQKPQAISDKNHVYSAEYYTNLISEAVKNKKMSSRQKVETYEETLALAYLDGYNKSELENILLGNGTLDFSYYRKKTYVESAIKLAEQNRIKQEAAETLDSKITELKNIKIDINNEELENCTHSMINEIAKIQENSVKEVYVNKLLNILKNNSSKTLKSDLISFIQEVSNINDDFKLQYEIYIESVHNGKIKTLKTQIEKMINNVSDANYHEKRREFLTKFYVAKDLKELESLRDEIQKLLYIQFSEQKTEAIPTPKESNKLSIVALSNGNQKLVDKLLKCKSPKTMSLTFEEVKNLLEDIGFVETNVSGTHHKFLPPIEILFNGKKQAFLTIASHGIKTTNPALIDDLINVCKQYYGTEVK